MGIGSWIIILGIIVAVFVPTKSNNSEGNSDQNTDNKKDIKEKGNVSENEETLLSNHEDTNKIQKRKDIKMNKIEEEFMDIIIEEIREYMLDRFYIEGEEKDYYFGKSILNNGLTIFYNDNAHVVGSNLRIIVHKLPGIIHAKFNNFGVSLDSTDLEKSAFNIPVEINKLLITPAYKTDPVYLSTMLNIMPPKVLEEAIEKNPERWELYKSRQNKSMKKIEL